MEPQINPKKSFFSEWLEKLQQESWQLELLISGLALFGIWESRSLLRHLEYYIEIHSIGSFDIWLKLFVIFMKAGWLIFMINLLIHIIIRGFWIGAIGLRYVSGDIDFSSLNYSSTFEEYYKRKIGSFDDYIEKLEKISSVLFSFTFLLFFMFLSFLMFNVTFGLFVSIVHKFILTNDDTFGVAIGFIAMLYYGLGLLVLIDFFALGALKKIKDKTVSKIYLWIYRFYSFISFSFLYRPLLLNFIDNSYTRKLFFLGIPYSLLLLSTTGLYIERYPVFPDFNRSTNYLSEINKHSVNHNFYDDLREQHQLTYNNGNEMPYKSKIDHLSLSKYEYNQGEMFSFFIEYEEDDEEKIKGINESVFAYRNKGMRHKFFYNKKVKDEGLEEIEAQESKESIWIRKVINQQDIEEIPDSIVAKYSGFEKTDIDSLRAVNFSKFENLKRDYLANRVSTLKNGLLNQHLIKIDQDTITALECNFYIHPNLHERGLLCHYNIDSLSKGQHILELSKSNKNCANCYSIKARALFRKN